MTTFFEKELKAFDTKFTREDGLIDKYSFDDESGVVSTPEAIKNFIREHDQRLIDMVIEKVSKKEMKPDENISGNSNRSIYNQALLDVKEDLETLKKEL